MQRTVFITGANRGIGYEFARQFLQSGNRVIAACRQPEEAQELQALSADREHLRVLALDLEDESSIQQVAREVEALGWDIEVLIHNAGRFATGERGVEGVQSEELLGVFRVNFLGPLLLTKALLPALERASFAKIFVLGSRTGALRPPPVTEAGCSQFSYPCSKAAVHRMIPILAADMLDRGITVAGLDPGWVRTGMTNGANIGNRFMLSPVESVRGMLEVMQKANLRNTGTIWRWTGDVCRWYAPEETNEERQIAE